MSDKCPKCGMEEVSALHPRTLYACGSSDFDRRPGTFWQSPGCKRIVEFEDVLKMIRDHIDGGLESEDIHKWIDDVLKDRANEPTID